ncbi:hypothetical protein DSM112329_04960 [Paraconexibacter sp. AEG42_29]|uniref:SpoVT-AbrB domain-containing protein n=1 Tax=Paraconexibacter sp. AEG42_29 TaxID=2997339 RepID=A0AAU7B2B1_9ACTN
MRLTSKGQVTIPKDLRERHGLAPGTEVEFVSDGTVLQLRRAWTAPTPDELESRLSGLEAAKDSWNGMTADEVMRLTRGDA